ncbi:MAG: LysM peptidoglycan-binding domain-containing protein [Actinomycetota bacterium]
MTRVLAIIALSGLLMFGEVAFANRARDVRMPVTVDSAQQTQDDPDTVVVKKGDHLWKISARQVDGGAGEIAPYWRRVVEVNTPRLRSGDPDLIYPGEIVELPPAIP